MAVISNLLKTTVQAMLNNGTKDGKVKTLTVTIGPEININKYDNQKAMNIVNAMELCLAKSVYEVIKTEKTKLTNDD